MPSFEQRLATDRKVDQIFENGGQIVEDPILLENETFGPCYYFTAKYGGSDACPWKASYIEYGVKPNGEVFTVN